MKLNLLYIILAILIQPLHSMAGKYLEPKFFNIVYSKDYYEGVNGYNMQKPCDGPMCIPKGSEVTCSSYSYPKHMRREDTRMQVCNLATIKNEALKISMDVSDKDYRIVTGLIGKDGKIDYHLPEGESYIASLWRVIDYQVKKLEPVAEDPKINITKPHSWPSTEAGVCSPGFDCYNSKNPCYLSGPLNQLICIKDTVNPSPPEWLIPEPEVIESEDSKFDHKKIADAFKIGTTDKFFNERCLNFIDKEGYLGARGKKVLSTIKKVGEGCFTGEESIDVSGVCPKFKEFSAKQKEYFWVWVFASIATDESKCGDPRWLINHKAANGVGYGLLQMEGETWRKNNGRSKKYCPHYKIVNENETFQFECSVSILTDTNCKKGWALNSSKGYWAELRKNGEVTKLIRKFPGCY